jgi:PPIC-type PPIASE domain
MRTGAMNRVTALVFLACCAAAVGWLMIHERDETPFVTDKMDAGAAGHGGGSHLEPSTAVGGSGGAAVAMGGAPPALQLGDGGIAEMPALSDAPKSVNFGVVLVQYKGAEGAKSDARSRADAKKLADELDELAKQDFEAAVKKGDPGSVVDAGRMFRGILEPAADYALFSLEEGKVSDPVDTPRGYWIVKRRK